MPLGLLNLAAVATPSAKPYDPDPAAVVTAPVASTNFLIRLLTVSAIST